MRACIVYTCISGHLAHSDANAKERMMLVEQCLCVGFNGPENRVVYMTVGNINHLSTT